VNLLLTECGTPAGGGALGKKAWSRGDGPFARSPRGFRQSLIGRGYLSGAVKHHGVLMGQLNRWLTGQRLGMGDLTAARAEEFPRHVARGGPEADTYYGDFGGAHRASCCADLRSAERTPEDNCPRRLAGPILAERGPRVGGEVGIEGLTAAEVNTFLMAATSRLVFGSAKREAADLRSFPRFLYVAGLLEVDLGRGDAAGRSVARNGSFRTGVVCHGREQVGR
jgi:integrase/recombinase XerD